MERLKKFMLITVIFLSTCLLTYAGQTGKIAGHVTDKETGEAVIGANIIIDGTYLGAAADIDGYYYINNVPPGTYDITVSAVGYAKTKVSNVVVKIDKTTALDIELSSEAISLGQDVIVTAERPLITKDLTSTAATISAEEIQMLPVDNISQVINLQAGVMDGHFRGGRSNEVSYLVDGVPVTDVFSGSNSVQVENSAVRELEVISGTFNAEYGQALSGIVNIVTKEGSQKYEALVMAGLGSYFSTDKDIFNNLNTIKPTSVADIQISLSGPTKILKDLTFFVNGRYFEDDGPYYGKRKYKVDDKMEYRSPDGLQYIIPTGDSAFVAMDKGRSISANAKLTYTLPDWKFSYAIFLDNGENTYYSHAYKWTPDGIKTHFSDNMVHNFQISYIPSQSIFTSLKFSANNHHFKGYLYEDELDPRYVDPYLGSPTSSYTFRQGGNETDRYERSTKTYIGQWALEAQVSKEHKVKMGVEGQYHVLQNAWKTLVNLTEGQVDEFNELIWTPGYRNLNTDNNQYYEKRPFQVSAFVQDKMEYDIMIINAGLRFDYFNSNTTIPVDLKNPSQINANPSFPGPYETKKVDAKLQVSPRIGVSFPISDQGAIYFSYGHFFQIPNFENLYRNDLYIITQGQSLSSISGNPDLDAQKTIKYEIGLQQVVFPNISLDITAYYSDIRNLLGMEIINTYEGFKYARFINRDYGNVRGLILTLERRFSDYFSAKIDYTYQVAEGNASDPLAVYNDNQSNPPVESEKKVVPLDWDQRSTLNFTASVGEPGNWLASIILQYGSGTPFTEDIQISNGVRFENGGRKPTYLNLDMKLDKSFSLYGINIGTYLVIYNVFDIRNETGVYSTTGRANSDLNVKYAGQINGLNTIEEYINNPQMYSSPRQIRLGLNFGL
ncbi:MAG: TonB-dependent receptor [bacterium]